MNCPDTSVGCPEAKMNHPDISAEYPEGLRKRKTKTGEPENMPETAQGRIVIHDWLEDYFVYFCLL